MTEPDDEQGIKTMCILYFLKMADRQYCGYFIIFWTVCVLCPSLEVFLVCLSLSFFLLVSNCSIDTLNQTSLANAKEDHKFITISFFYCHVAKNATVSWVSQHSLH